MGPMLLEHTPSWPCGYSDDSTVGLIHSDVCAGGRMLLQMGEKSSTSDSEAGASGRDHTGAPLKTTIEGLEQDTIAGLIPVNFITLATPHLGCRGNNHVSVIPVDLFFQLRNIGFTQQ